MRSLFLALLLVALAVTSVLAAPAALESDAPVNDGTQTCFTLYEHTGYGGAAFGGCGSVADLRFVPGPNWGHFNDVTSSLRVSGIYIRVFRDAGYRDVSLKFFTGGQLALPGWMADHVSSVCVYGYPGC